jgi:hypothetical protein
VLVIVWTVAAGMERGRCSDKSFQTLMMQRFRQNALPFRSFVIVSCRHCTISSYCAHHHWGIINRFPEASPRGKSHGALPSSLQECSNRHLDSMRARISTFSVVVMKSDVVWDIRPCSSLGNRPCGLVVSLPGYTTMYSAFCEVRTNLYMYVM